MKIRTKLYLGVGLLFILIILLAFVTIRQINSLAEASENIIKDNKETVVFSTNMLKALAEIEQDSNALDSFEKDLKKQMANITESGEKELTQKLYTSFCSLKKDRTDKTALINARRCLFEIISLNLQSINTKNEIASKTATRSIVLISMLSTFCFVIALTMFINLPGNITNPIREIIGSFRQIEANDYSQRVYFEGNSELSELAESFNSMARKLDEYNKSNIAKLLSEKKLTGTLINQVQYPIISLDKNLKITLVNEEFLTISGLQKDEVIGKPILELAQENDLIRQLIVMNPGQEDPLKAEKGNSTIHIERQGKGIYYEKEIQEISYTSHFEEENHLMGYVIILKNITRFIDLDLAKSRFIATISHELKTPISALKFSLQLLGNDQTGSLNPEQLDLVKSCDEDTNNLLKIISELLDITQIETGNIQLNIAPSGLMEILNYALNISKPLAEQKNITFITNLPEHLPEVLADKEKTAWVLTNLISNAIHYSFDHSRILISISDDGLQQTVTVEDSGQGIDLQYKEKIFDRYFRIPGTKNEGTGLGLAICKEFIEAQGGQIRVESEPGKGSTFSILLNNA